LPRFAAAPEPLAARVAFLLAGAREALFRLLSFEAATFFALAFAFGLAGAAVFFARAGRFFFASSAAAFFARARGAGVVRFEATALAEPDFARAFFDPPAFFVAAMKPFGVHGACLRHLFHLRQQKPSPAFHGPLTPEAW
jgi:hypothetical protein